MNVNLIMVLSLVVCQSIYSVNVSFSQTVEGGNKITHIYPGSAPQGFKPNKMFLNDARETYMTLVGTADEKITFSGNWEYAMGSDAASPDWTPMTNIPSFEFARNEAHTYKIRCTTKPAYPLIITSTQK